jgi:hypothetical protein
VLVALTKKQTEGRGFCTILSCRGVTHKGRPQVRQFAISLCGRLVEQPSSALACIIQTLLGGVTTVLCRKLVELSQPAGTLGGSLTDGPLSKGFGENQHWPERGAIKIPRCSRAPCGTCGIQAP